MYVCMYIYIYMMMIGNSETAVSYTTTHQIHRYKTGTRFHIYIIPSIRLAIPINKSIVT